MPDYRRLFVPGGTYFFTLCLADRRADTLIRLVDLLRAAYRKGIVVAPVDTLAICILPDHLHMVWRLPEGDHDFSNRIGQFKGAFTRTLPANIKRDGRKRERGVWQSRFWASEPVAKRSIDPVDQLKAEKAAEAAMRSATRAIWRTM